MSPPLAIIRLCKRFCVVLFLLPLCAYAQPQADIVFDFNDHTFNEKRHRVNPTPVGVTLVNDRFGNARSSLYVHGHNHSYLTLGTSDLLKPIEGSISLWVKLDRKVYAGKGYESNPFLCARRSAGEDFYDAFSVFYDFRSDRLVLSMTNNEYDQVILSSLEPFTFGKWLHVAFVYNNHFAAFYINGEKQAEATKEFQTSFLKNSPVNIANGDSQKNLRTARGSVDDIMFFHRVLSEAEILELYHAPNPNQAWLLFITVLKYAGFVVLAIIIAFLLVWQRRRSLARAKEKLDVNRKLHELETRILKAQMNPHFIFNSLNSIQQFIMTHDHERAQEYLAKFSKLIRQQLESNVNESLSIQDEVDMLNGYIEMELLRFSHAFEYKIEIDARIVQAETLIPHLTVQPFVENAIWHGLLPQQQGLRQLHVRFEWISDKLIACTVDDNGVGRQAEKTSSHTFKKQSLALSLVQTRLDLLSKTYRVDCGVDIQDKTGPNGQAAGVQVSIRLPVLNQ